jgi:hypothetical protein
MRILSRRGRMGGHSRKRVGAWGGNWGLNGPGRAWGVYQSSVPECGTERAFGVLWRLERWMRMSLPGGLLATRIWSKSK